MKLCDTCFYGDKYEYDKPCVIYSDHCEMYEQKVGKIKRQAFRQELKWIPVSERMPEDGTWNLFTDGKNVSVERYKADALDHFYPNGRWFSLDEAIAWMPLPTPYKPKPQESEEISEHNMKMWEDIFKAESDHKCHTCKHYTSGEYGGSCGSYICKGYSNWERKDKE